uniref:Uncharacterized protein n=1 Tax=Romanomermis culicivorax TaxID=13658 RepID=A0A915JYP5_ROMCU
MQSGHSLGEDRLSEAINMNKSMSSKHISVGSKVQVCCFLLLSRCTLRHFFQIQEDAIKR